MNNLPDKYQCILDQLITQFKQKLPDYSIAITGSLALKNWNYNSDIDLLCLSKKIKSTKRIVNYVNGIRVNIICFNPDLLQNGLEKNRLLTAYHPSIVHYILFSKKLIDNDNILLITQNKIRDIIKLRIKTRTQLINSLSDKFKRLLDYYDIVYNDHFEQRRVLLASIETCIQIWFLKKNKYYFNDKNRYLNILLTVKSYDQQFYHMISNCFPIKPDGTQHLSEIFSYLGKCN